MTQTLGCSLAEERKKAESDSTNWDVRLSSELGDKLIERREKFNYFIVTAAVSVVVFTFNNLNKDSTLFKGRSDLRGFLVWGCIGLLGAALLALYSIYERHRQYARWLSIQDHGDPKGRIASRMDRADVSLTVASAGIPTAFLAGMSLLLVAYLRVI